MAHRANNTAHAALRAEVLAAAVAEMKQVGTERFRIAKVAAVFRDRGVHVSTIYAWIAKANKSGRLTQELVADIKKTATQRAKKTQKANLDNVVHRLVPIATLEDIASSGPLRVIDCLRQCFSTAQAVIRHSKNEDGTPRNVALLLAASEHMRRCVETAHRIAKQVNQLQQVEQFHRALIDEVKKESPACAERIFQRFEQMSEGISL